MESSEVSFASPFHEEGRRMEGTVPVTFGSTFAYGFFGILGLGIVVLVLIWVLRKRSAMHQPHRAAHAELNPSANDTKLDNSNTDVATASSSIHSTEPVLSTTLIDSTMCKPPQSTAIPLTPAQNRSIPKLRFPEEEDEDDSYQQRLEEHPLQVQMLVHWDDHHLRPDAPRRACRVHKQRLEEMVPGDEELGLRRCDEKRRDGLRPKLFFWVPPVWFWYSRESTPPPAAVSVSSDSDDEDSLDEDMQRHLADMGILVDL